MRVRKDGLDWGWECPEHGSTYAADWELAYESAVGHTFMCKAARK